jgi:hypothetical protein
MPTKSTLPKPIAELIAREGELQAAVDRWGVPAFRSERDRLEAVVHSGAASDADIEAHAASRDGGEVDLHYRSMEGSSRAALDAHRSTNWPTFREFLRTRLAARHQREADIVVELAQVCAKYGIEVAHNDPDAAVTRQLEGIVERESVGFIRYGTAVETF